jgi:predicted RNA-binding Zn-ribbon protein involved in translation (DUF1610 family)
MERKNLVIGVVLLAVIIAAVVLTVRRSTVGDKTPDAIMNRQIQRIDYKTSEIISESFHDWLFKYGVDEHTGRFKSPKTGEFSMVDIVKCASCGKLIPVPYASMDDKKDHPDLYRSLQEAYLCPLCGKHAYIVGVNF